MLTGNAGRRTLALRWRDVGGAVIAALHPFAPLGTSGGFDRGAGRLDISSGTLRGSPDLLCKLRSLIRIECDNRVNVSRVKKAVDDWINQTAQTVEVNVPEVQRSAIRLRTPEVGRWPSASGDSERCLVDESEAGLQLARR
jgi:hypothetical protein